MAMAADQMSWPGPHVIVPIRAGENVPVAINPISAALQARLKRRTMASILTKDIMIASYFLILEQPSLRRSDRASFGIGLDVRVSRRRPVRSAPITSRAGFRRTA